MKRLTSKRGGMRCPGKRQRRSRLKECRKAGLKLFFYHSHLDWYRPDYHPRAKTGRNTGRPKARDFDRYLDYMKAQKPSSPAATTESSADPADGDPHLPGG